MYLRYLAIGFYENSMFINNNTAINFEQLDCVIIEKYIITV